MQQHQQSQRSHQQSPNSKIELKTPRENKTPTQKRRQKLTVFRSKSKQIFLTDAQTSDNTLGKSSSSLEIKLSVMQQKLRRLNKQNVELKECIINMKANQFYTVNQQKVKLAISQNERLKQEINSMQKLNQQLMIQNQFLQRNNRNLKSQLQNFTSNQLRKSIDMVKTSRIKDNSKRLLPNSNQNQQMSNKYQISLEQRLTNQRRTIQQVKSNPDLLKTSTNKYQVDSHQFIFKEKPSNREKNPIQNQRSSNNLLINKSRNSNQQFLKQFQKYQKQIFPFNQQKFNNQHKDYDESHNNPITPRNRKSPLHQQEFIKSKSKEISLQAMLEKKQQMMNNKFRQRQNKSKQFKHQYFNENDQNDPKISNFKNTRQDNKFEKQNDTKKQIKYLNNQKRKITNEKINRVKEVTSRERAYYPRG